MIDRLLTDAAHSIQAIGAGNPRLEAELLLAEALGKSRVFLFTHPETRLTARQRARFDELLGRRLSGEPLQYVLGTADFRHLTLRVGPGVLIPRSETERVVDFVWASLQEWRRWRSRQPSQAEDRRGRRWERPPRAAAEGRRDPNARQRATDGAPGMSPGGPSRRPGDRAEAEVPWVIDVGVGSGAILLALMDEARREEAGLGDAWDHPRGPAKIWEHRDDQRAGAHSGPWFHPLGIDVSPVALESTLENAAVNELPRPHLVQGHLLSCFSASDPPMPVAAIVSNPPYIASEQLADLPPEIREHEPRGALDGGPGGLAVIRELLDAALAFIMRGTLLAFEIGAAQAQDVRRELRQRGLLDRAVIHPDLAGRPRVVLVEPWRGGAAG